MKILKKAYIVYHDGMIGAESDFVNRSLEDIEPVYADSPSRAKISNHDAYDWDLGGRTPAYTDLKVKRFQCMDKVEHGGFEYYRGTLLSKLSQEKKKKERIEKLKELPDGEYYIQTSGWVGNCPLFWALKSQGYTTDVTRAQKYSKEEMISICKNEDQKPWPVEFIDSITRPTVHADRLDYSKTVR